MAHGASNSYGCPALADMDHDGDVEIAFGHQVFDHQGNLVFSGSYGDGRNFMSVPVDWDLDGTMDLVAGNAVYDLNGNVIQWLGLSGPPGSKIYFASDRPDGYGGIDIYMCQKLPNGKWSQAQNLGPTINTKFDEDFPNISPDGKVLYFSSRGHTSMGGYDIFKAEWNPLKRKFGAVRNIGYPINTPEDNMNFRVSKSGRFGYISALRKGGFGDLDIYRVTFREVEPEYTVITGKIVPKSGEPKFEDVLISVTDEETGDIYGDYIPNMDNMRYVMILPPGKYEVFVGCYGYEEIIENIEVLDKSSFQSHIEKDIIVTPVNN
ncbi:MAG: PD40 domain-containing protein [Flavobacteriales bacterium]|nr:PD40 domain-containing protein [Flavobacteriales bacterium]